MEDLEPGIEDQEDKIKNRQTWSTGNGRLSDRASPSIAPDAFRMGQGPPPKCAPKPPSQAELGIVARWVLLGAGLGWATCNFPPGCDGDAVHVAQWASSTAKTTPRKKRWRVSVAVTSPSRGPEYLRGNGPGVDWADGGRTLQSKLPGPVLRRPITRAERLAHLGGIHLQG